MVGCDAVGRDTNYSAIDSDRDMLMLMNLNGRERTMEAFRGLCDSVQPRLKVHEIHHPAQGELSLIELKRCDATF